MSSTFTPRLGLLKPTPGTGEPVNLAEMNNGWDAIDAAVGASVCTSSTRPSAPFDGQMIRETDTGLLYVRNGTESAWVNILTENSTIPANATLCTSGSRPPSPDDGQFIYETDTGLVYVYTGSAWLKILTEAYTPPTPAEPVNCRAYCLVPVPTSGVNNSTLVLVPLEGESWDVGNMHSTITNNSRVIVPAGQGGKFDINAKVSWASNPNGRRVLTIRKNAAGISSGGVQVGLVSVPAAPVSGTDVMFSDTLLLNGGDYLEIFALQNSGSTVNVEAGEASTFLNIQRRYPQ